MSKTLSTAFAGRDQLLRLLVEASEVVTAHVVDLDRLLRTIAELVRRVVDYEILAVLVTVNGQDALRICHAVGLPDDVVRNARVPFGHGITGTAASEQATIVSNDVSKDPRYICALDSVRSELAVPLIAHGKVVGVLDLQSTEQGAFTDYERRMIELIASRISLAVENARLFVQMSNQAETLRTLLNLSQEFSTVLNMDQLMEVIALVTRRLIDYDAYSIFLLDLNRNELRYHASFRYDGKTRLEAISLDTGIIGAAARTRRPVWIADTASDPNHGATTEGIRSEVALPMLLRGRLIGVLGLESKRANYFTREHVDTLSMLASQLAAAIENARLHEQVAKDAVKLKTDLETARRIQQQLLLPPCPVFEGLEIASRNRSLLAVSGDFYDFYPFPGSHLAFVLGDVSGKGAAAALYGALTSGLMRSFIWLQQSPGELLHEVNRPLAERPSSPATFAAVMCAYWNPAERSLLLANSGLPFPLVRQKGQVRSVPVEGVPLGMFPETRYEEHHLQMEPGDILVVASDGVLDSEDSSEEPYGQERLAAVVAQSGDCSPEAVIDRILDDVRRHTGGADVDDDQTLVVLRVK